ncbi:MAG: ribokinase [Clostridia bacterium]|nr:ribokinase [Clostridia bacterium]
MPEILVIGSFVMDNVARMEKMPEIGETVIGTAVELSPGGKGINQCISIARLGGKTEMIGMLGQDASGDTFKRIMKDEGIRCDGVFSCDKPTATAQIQIDAQGRNRICVIPSANHCFGFEHLEKIDARIKEADLLVLQLEMRLDVTLEIIRRAHSYGTKILLNPAPAVKLDAEILAMLDYVTPNETELSILTDMPTETDQEVKLAAKKLLSLGAKTVIATLGGRGALIATDKICEIVCGYSVAAIDTVAAGDSFNGALAVALTEGADLLSAVKFANAMGALTVTRKGAISSLHTRDEVGSFMTFNAQKIEI